MNQWNFQICISVPLRVSRRKNRRFFVLYKRTRTQFVVKQIPKKHHCPKKFLVTRLKRYILKLETNFFFTYYWLKIKIKCSWRKVKRSAFKILSPDSLTNLIDICDKQNILGWLVTKDTERSFDLLDLSFHHFLFVFHTQNWFRETFSK